jgi:hypothetical protein
MSSDESLSILTYSFVDCLSWAVCSCTGSQEIACYRIWMFIFLLTRALLTSGLSLDSISSVLHLHNSFL